MKCSVVFDWYTGTIFVFVEVLIILEYRAQDAPVDSAPTPVL